MNYEHEKVSLLGWKKIIACFDGSHKNVSRIFPPYSLPWGSVTTRAVTSSCPPAGDLSALFVKFPVSPWPLNDDATWLLSPYPLPLGLFTHSVGYHLQTNNSQIPVFSPALTPNIPIGRSTGPSAWFSEATQNQQTHELLNSRSLHSAQSVFALLKGTIHDPVAKRQGRLIPILPPLSVPAGSWPPVFISSCPWTSLHSVCPSSSLPA